MPLCFKMHYKREGAKKKAIQTIENIVVCGVATQHTPVAGADSKFNTISTKPPFTVV